MMQKIIPSHFLRRILREVPVQDAQINITDIDMLSEEHRKAIAFMVSRGYFAANDCLFDPNASLSRYDFAKTLVGMFFAYRDDLTTTFPDVPKDSMYYQYVASGENRKIIHGYEDQKFHGQNEVLIDEVIAFCSRTLTDIKNISSRIIRRYSAFCRPRTDPGMGKIRYCSGSAGRIDRRWWDFTS